MMGDPRRGGVTVPPANPIRNPGDEAVPGSAQTGEVTCQECQGSGRVQGGACPGCGGTGRVVRIVGDA